MKIAIISNSSKRIHISKEELFKEIIDSGHEILVIGPKFETGPMHEYECQKKLAALGVRYAGVNIDRIGMNPLSECKTIIELVGKLKDEKPDILLSIGLKMAVFSGISARFAKVEKTFHLINGRGTFFQIDNLNAKIVKSILFPVMKIIFNRCNKVFFQNIDDLQFFKEKKLVREKNCKVVNGSGVSLVRFPEEKMPMGPVFLLVARLVWAKGVREYAEASRIVKNIYPDARFLLVGPFDHAIGAIKESDLKKYTDNGIIEYLGTSNDVKKYYDMCSCYILPSFYGEGVPRTVLEAMSTGRPIITTNVPGCKETVKDSISGFLIPPKDITILAEKMCWMIENYEKSKIMAIESRRYCEQKFDVKIINKSMIETMGI